MKILDIGIITSKQEVFESWCKVNKEANASFWFINEIHSFRGRRFDLILKIELWWEVPNAVIEQSYTHLKRAK